MLLFLLLSGDVFLVGLGLAGCGSILGLWRPRFGTVLASVGVVLALASAVPLPSWLYLLLVSAFVAWAVAAWRSRTARRVATAFLLAACLVVFAASVVGRPSHPGSLEAPVFVLGDSLSAGLGADRSTTWPAHLATLAGGPVRNLAQPGARLVDGVSQASAVPPGRSVVLVELGGNDLLAGVEVGPFADSLRQLLREVSQPHRTVVMLELPLLPLQNRYGCAQWDVCTEFGVSLIPRRALAGAIALPGHTTDGLHLSAQGHRWLAERIAVWF